MRDGQNQYPPMAGVPLLRQAIGAKVDDLYGLHCDPETEVTVTAGATEALFCAIAAVVHAGDEVIVLDPAYDSYDPVIRLQGGVAVHVSLTAPCYRIDWERIEAAITSRTRLLILNSPHNPTGMVMQDADITALSALCARHDIYLIGDEVYEHMVFDQGKASQSLCVCGSVRAQLCDFFLWQDLSCDGLEGGLLHRSAPADSGVQAGSPVRDFYGEYAGAVGHRGFFTAAPRAPRATARVLSSEARCLLRVAAGFSIPYCAESGHLLSVARIR
jgi:hypothetical protein